jgi:hypothetical protein
MDDLRERLEAVAEWLMGKGMNSYSDSVTEALAHPEKLMDKAALTALQSEAGRVSVPRERLEELLAEIQHQFSLREDYQERDHAIELVEAMLSAAPSPDAPVCDDASGTRK